MEIENEVGRVLTLLRNKIRERGFTQLEVQSRLKWGRSYISQLLTRQKSLRFEQVLLVLDVIGVEPAEFFSELYHLSMRSPAGPANLDQFPDPPASGSRPARAARGGEAPVTRGELEEVAVLARQNRAMVLGMIAALIEKGLLNREQVAEKARKASQDDEPLPF